MMIPMQANSSWEEGNNVVNASGLATEALLRENAVHGQ